MKIIAHPHCSKDNNFIFVFYEGLEKAGASVSSFSLMTVLFGEYDVIHIHWPEFLFFRKSVWGSSVKTIQCLVTLWIARWVRRKKIVWFCHEPYPHDRNPRKYRHVVGLFLRAVSDVYYLSRVSQKKAEKFLPQLKNKSCLHFKHPVYPVPVVGSDHNQSSTKLLAFGLVRPYKNFLHLMEEVVRFNEVQSSGLSLRLIGRCDLSDLARKLEMVAKRSDKIFIKLEFVSEEELAEAIHCCDAVIFNYRDITNSGAAIRALSQGRAIIAPRIGALVELQEDFGEDRVFLFDDLNAVTLLSIEAWMKLVPKDFQCPPEYEMSYIAKRIIEKYDKKIKE